MNMMAKEKQADELSEQEREKIRVFLNLVSNLIKQKKRVLQDG